MCEVIGTCRHLEFGLEIISLIEVMMLALIIEVVMEIKVMGDNASKVKATRLED